MSPENAVWPLHQLKMPSFPVKGRGQYPWFHPPSAWREPPAALSLHHGEYRRPRLVLRPQFRGGVRPHRRGRFSPVASPLSRERWRRTLPRHPVEESIRIRGEECQSNGGIGDRSPWNSRIRNALGQMDDTCSGRKLRAELGGGAFCSARIIGFSLPRPHRRRNAPNSDAESHKHEIFPFGNGE
jgi:hypothetical protein